MTPKAKYEALLEQIEELEDRLTVVERADDEVIPWEEVKKEIKKKIEKYSGTCLI